MAWVTAKDFTDSWIGDDVPTNTSKIELWLARAERKVRRDVPGIGIRLSVASPELEPDLPDTFKDVIIEMVTRVFRNPTLARSIQEGTGPLSGSVVFGGDNPGTLYLTEENLADLAPPEDQGEGDQRAFSINLGPADKDKHPLEYSWVNGPDHLSPSTDWWAS